MLSATVIAAGGAVGLAIGTLDRDLPDVKAFRDLGFAQPTLVYDRSGKTLLASFWEERREVIDYEKIPQLILDVTTAVEDDTFWENPGFDLEATVNAMAQEFGGGGDRGGASTITQQLVRARLLPTEVVARDNTQEGLYTRKAMEILQAFKLTQAFPGEQGKKDIITAYLNEIYYGQKAYGIAAAADVYFHKKLDQLTVAEAAMLAGIPQRPYEWDPYNYAHTEKVRGKGKKGKATRRLVVSPEPGRWETRHGKPTTFNANKNVRWRVCKHPEADSCAPPPPVVRRAFTLRRLNEGKGRWTSLSDEQLEAALKEPIVLAPPRSVTYKAPHFVIASIAELKAILGDRDPITTGGYKVYTTLDMRAQKIGERVVQGGAVLPNLPLVEFYKKLNELKLRGNAGWISRLRGSNLHNGALVAEDYRTGDILAYVGSAGYYRKKTPQFAPQVDHIGGSWRQPGSAWKPILYATGIDTERLTAGTYLLDQQETFSPGWTPKNADGTYRGLVRVREAHPAVAQHPGHPGPPAGRLPHRPEVRREGGLHVPRRQQQDARPGQPGGSAGDRRGAADRHDHGLRRLRQRRQGHEAALHPQGRGTRRHGHLRGRQAHHQAGLEAGHGLHHGRHPLGQHEPCHQPGLGCGLRDAQHARRLAPRGGHQDRHDQRAQGLLDLRLPADAQEQEATRARGRRLVRQQRQLEPQPRSPALLDGQRRPDLGGLRARVHEQQASPRVQATEGCRQRRVRDLHRGHAARRLPPGGHVRAQGHDDDAQHERLHQLPGPPAPAAAAAAWLPPPAAAAAWAPAVAAAAGGGGSSGMGGDKLRPRPAGPARRRSRLAARSWHPADPAPSHSVDEDLPRVPVYADPVDGHALAPKRLETWTARLIERLGAPADIASDVAALLLASDRRGIASHGTARLPQYVALVEAGVLDPTARPAVLRRRAAIALLDARNGWGHHASRVAVDMAIDGAREAGSFTAVVRRSNHYGIAGWYAIRAAEAGLIGISLTNSSPLVAPTRARQPMLGTNPIAVAAPAGRHGIMLPRHGHLDDPEGPHRGRGAPR